MGSKSMKPTASMRSAASTVKAAKSMEPTASAKSMKPTASAMKPTASTTPAVKPTASTAPTVKPTASTPTAMPGDCRNVSYDAKRANRNARCQNAYRFLLHDAFPISKS